MEKERNKILSILGSLRYLFDDIFHAEDILLEDAMSLESTKDMVYPCDVIDLRDILASETISYKTGVPLFGINFSEKYLKRFPIFIVLNVLDLEENNLIIETLGAIKICQEEISVKDMIVRIQINKPLPEEVCDTIVSIADDYNYEHCCSVSNSIPGLSSPNPRLAKVAQRTVGVSSELELDTKETDIFNFLREVKKEMGLNVQMRVVGGWVRDKLLGKESDDIDIAVDMSGTKIAEIVAKAAVRHNITHDPKFYEVSLVKNKNDENAGPDELKVGAVYLFGLKIEFVPMRTEHYPDKFSRTPKITFTKDPKEDATRRDLTINAMYYNIDTGRVEDFIGGKEDLLGEAINLKMPGNPYRILMEDPLRALRALRFFSRYKDSKLDPTIVGIIKDPKFKEAFRNKVKEERIGDEIIKTLKGEKPAEAMRILFETGLYEEVFGLNQFEDLQDDKMRMNQQNVHHKYILMEHTLKVLENYNNIAKLNGEDDDIRVIGNLAAIFHDIGKMKKDVQTVDPKNPDNRQYINHERLSKKMAIEIMNSWSVPQDYKDKASKVIGLHMAPLQGMGMKKLLRRSRIKGNEEEFSDYKDLWKIILYHSQADSMSSTPEDHKQDKHDAKFNEFSNYVNNPVSSFKGHVINGNDIIPLFPELDKSTGFIREVLQRIRSMQDNGVIDMSFANMPEGSERNMALQTSKNQAIEQILNMKPDIIIQFSGGTMAKNWFKKVVESQVLSLEDKDTEDITKGPQMCKSPYSTGMKVRDRRKGVALPQDFGIVKSILADEMVIDWFDSNNKKRGSEKFNIKDDSVELAMIVSGI
ncbi:MAG: CCA tRNA nucleotidyltransferase [Clostridiales bacterium]|nr:CCA tRNA nucleotidyltransferase [Clostridiales bacterium]